MDEGGIGLATGKQALEGVDQDRVGSTQLTPAGLTQRKHAFDESLPLLIACAEAALATKELFIYYLNIYAIGSR
jgi:hypothetical protein